MVSDHISTTMADLDWKFGLKCYCLKQLAVPKTHCGQVRFLEILILDWFPMKRKLTTCITLNALSL